MDILVKNDTKALTDQIKFSTETPLIRRTKDINSQQYHQSLQFNFQSELCSSITSQDSSIVSADHSIIYRSHVKDRTIKELLKQKIILFDNNETRL